MEEAFVFSVDANSTSKLATLELFFNFDGGTSESHTVYLPIGSPTLLFIDDDNGAEYEKYYEELAIHIGEFASTWSILEDGSIPLDTLNTYKHAVWFTGDDSKTSLTPEEQAIIKQYLADGGHLTPD